MRIRVRLFAFMLAVMLLAACASQEGLPAAGGVEGNKPAQPSAGETMAAAPEATAVSQGTDATSQSFALALPKEGVIRVVPEALFTGDEKKYQPFVGAMSGGVKISYTGKKEQLGIEVELWEAGTKQKTVVSSYTPMRKADKSGLATFDGELIAAITEQNTEGKSPRYEIKFAVVSENGSVSSVFETEKKPSFQVTGTMTLAGQAEGKEETGIAIWGMQATDGNSLSQSGSVEETAKQAKYAIVFRVVATDG